MSDVLNVKVQHVCWRWGSSSAHALTVVSSARALLVLGALPRGENAFPVIGCILHLEGVRLVSPLYRARGVHLPKQSPFGVYHAEVQLSTGTIRYPAGLRSGWGAGKVTLLTPEAIHPILEHLEGMGWTFAPTPYGVVGHRVDPYTGGVLGEIEIWIENPQEEESDPEEEDWEE